MAEAIYYFIFLRGLSFTSWVVRNLTIRIKKKGVTFQILCSVDFDNPLFEGGEIYRSVHL